LHRWATASQGPGQLETQREIATESENIRLAWEWAVGHAQYDRLAQGLDGLGRLYERLCLYRSGDQVLTGAISPIESALAHRTDSELALLLARLLSWQGCFKRMLGDTRGARQAIQSGLDLLDNPLLQARDIRSEKAFLLQQSGLLEFSSDRNISQQDLSESLDLYRSIEDRWHEAQVLTSLAMTANAFGHYWKAYALLEGSLAIQRLLGDQTGMADTLLEMSGTLAEFGDFETMSKVIEEHALITREFGSPAHLALNLSAESVNLCYLGRFTESARRMEESISIFENLGNESKCSVSKQLLNWIKMNDGHFENIYVNNLASLAMSRQHGDLYGMAMNLWGLGEYFLTQGDYAEAYKSLEECAAFFRQVHQEDELCLVLAELADIEFRLNLSHPAKCHHQEAIRIAASTGSWQASLGLIGKTALILARQGEVEKGVELYALATRYPYLGNSRFWEATAGQYIAKCADELPEEVVTAAKERGIQRDLNEAVRELFTFVEDST
jgi:tetratricopeptide (TPR) repeat protein